ncbi:hypothetical protein E9529_14780 [Blastococcus sp. KM273128]|uniref:hypothetical protein n=1 Tax=Blastococcus sp. KM273128 TaxID=2570314 RepID=UPI001F15DA71|nr:hypothetical protein [Blastococcus sp. KM273128]MCF6745513.1 hypothetical protein [Blastococcus sp. KM273128]
MPVPPHRPAELRGRAFRGSDALAAGTLSRGRLRGPSWQRLFRDVYACADLPVTHALRARAAAQLLVPGAVVSGASAAVLWGLPLAGPLDDVELTVAAGANVCREPGVRVRRRDLAPDQVARRGGVPVTSAELTVLDLAGTGPLDDAVVLVDRFVDLGVTRLAWVREAAARARGRGCRQARVAAGLADGLAGSPQETRLRLLLHRSGLPRPVAQHVVRDAAGFVGRVDFGWPELRVAVEYEGRWHGESPQRVAADRRRLNRLRAAGWTVVFATAEDLADPARLLRWLAEALGC